MLIAIDGNEANVQKRVGVGRYAFGLLTHLAKLSDKEHQFKIYLKSPTLVDLPRQTNNWQYQVIGPKFFWTKFGLPLALFKDQPRSDVFLSLSHYGPGFSPVPGVISVLDLAFWQFPAMFRKKDLWQLKSWTRSSILKSAGILTISESSKRDIIKYYQVPRDKVVVTYPGFEMKQKKTGQVKINGDYVLSVGTLQPRKNYERLIEAFAKLDNPSIKLVIVGKQGWLCQDILNAPKKFGVADRVEFLDFVTDENLIALYKKAKCFVLVSLYEGFGIPPLEAMTLGCPVVVSNISSLPEVVGKVGILVDPYKVESIAGGINKVLSFSSQQREIIVEEGYIQAKKFSWEKCAQQTLEVLEKLGGS